MNIDEKQNELLQKGFNLGDPTSAFEILENGGCYQRFEHATIYENPNRQAFEVHGAILAKYREFNEMNGDLGFPTSDEWDDERFEIGKFSNFDYGYITWNPTAGAEVTITQQRGQLSEQESDRNLSADPIEIRNKYPSYVKKHPHGYYYYGNVNTQPQSVTEGTVEYWIWKEIASEGSFDSINAYDNMSITWGKGLAKENMLKVVKALFAQSPDIELQFNQVGIEVIDGVLQIINSADHQVTIGESAFHLFKQDPKLSDFLVHITKDQLYSQMICDVQWSLVVNMHGGLIAYAKANNWNEDGTRLAFHFNHWYPAYGWNGHSDAYKASDGDPLTIIMLFMKYQKGTDALIVSYLKKFADNAFKKYIALAQYLTEQENTYAFQDGDKNYYVPKL